ncbi:MAG: methyltransferase domain-containing protein [Bacteroidota bacterium]
MVTNIVEQQSVREWFNKTYQNRGLSYLRPQEAYYVFLEILKAKAGASILDVACGPGQLLKIAKEYQLDLHGVDISDVGIKMAKESLPNADLRVANAEQLPFANNSFDYITCIGSLERMLHLQKVLQEIRRVSKADAEICFMVRNSNRASWKLVKEKLGIINKKGHQGANTLDTWQQTFEHAGFKVKNVYPDVWPSRRWAHWFSLGGKLFSVDYKKKEEADESIDYAYEFIFHLSLS